MQNHVPDGYNIGEAFGMRVCFQDIEYIFQNRHFPIAAGIIGSYRLSLLWVMPFFIVGLDIRDSSKAVRSSCVIVRNQQGEKINMQPLECWRASSDFSGGGRLKYHCGEVSTLRYFL